jgi:hypothetical protein
LAQSSGGEGGRHTADKKGTGRVLLKFATAEAAIATNQDLSRYQARSLQEEGEGDQGAVAFSTRVRVPNNLPLAKRLSTL